MKILQTVKWRFWSEERGFTLPELLVTIAIMGIIFGTVVPTWRSISESREVTSATNQFVADLRKAHSTATNRLSAARVVFSRTNAGVTCNGTTADYCLVEPTASGTPRQTPRNLPGNVRLESPNISADPAGGVAVPGGVGGTTSTVEFSSSGSSRTLNGALSATGVTDNCPGSTPTGIGRVQITTDGNPAHCVTVRTATSRVKID